MIKGEGGRHLKQKKRGLRPGQTQSTKRVGSRAWAQGGVAGGVGDGVKEVRGGTLERRGGRLVKEKKGDSEVHLISERKNAVSGGGKRGIGRKGRRYEREKQLVGKNIGRLSS